MTFFLPSDHIGNLNEMCRHTARRPSTSLRYAQDERFSAPFVLSVTRRVKSKHERRIGTNDLGKLYKEGRSDIEYLAFTILFPGRAWEHSPNGAYLMRVSTG